MIKRILFLSLILILSSFCYAQTIPVTFQIDMSVQITLGGFDPATNQVVVRGDFETDAGDSTNWAGNNFVLSDAGNGVYSRVVDLPSSKEGTQYNYKFVIPGATDSWEQDGVGEGGASNRFFVLTGPSQVLPVVFWNNAQGAGVTNTFNFTCDMTGIYGSGPGFFDPNVDSVLVMGLDWDGGTAVKGNRRMVEDPFQPGIFHASLTCTQSNVDQDSTAWKFKAYPDGSFTNGGWETGDNNWVHYGADGATIDLPSLVPRIFPALGPTTVDVPVLFSVDMGQNPINSWDNSAITDIQFVGLKGELVELGSWGGNWVAADTTGGAPPTQTMLVCNDAGLNGDKVAGDHVWSRLVTIAAGVGGGVKEYKYGAMYPGASAAAGTQAHVMDNENGFGLNHQFILHDATAIDLKVTWGIMGLVDVRPVKDAIPVKYDLGQNYPNPFNPATTIRYSLKERGIVTLKVYNLIGQEVVTLVNSEQPAGVYEVNFDAGRLTSGVYLYTLNTGNFTQTKKMILMK
jgi:hypothetical protein